MVSMSDTGNLPKCEIGRWVENNEFIPLTLTARIKQSSWWLWDCVLDLKDIFPLDHSPKDITKFSLTLFGIHDFSDCKLIKLCTVYELHD